MNNKQSVGRTRGALLFTVFIILCCGQARLYADESRTLRLAAPLALSGIAAEHSENIRNGIELAKSELEQQGWKVEVAYEDTTAQAARVVTAVQSLLARGHRFFIGPTWSYMVAAARPLFERYDTVVYSPATSTEVTAGPSPNVFQGASRHSGKLEALSPWLKNRQFTRAALIVSEADWGTLHRGIFEQACRNAGIEIVLSRSYQLDAEDEVVRNFAGIISGRKPDVVLADLNKGGTAIFLRRMDEHGFRPPVIGVEKMRDAFTQSLIVSGPGTPRLYVMEIPLKPEFVERFKSHFGTSPGSYSDSAYDGVMILARAVSATDGSPQAVRNYLRDRLSYEGASGYFDFDSNGDVVKSKWQILPVNSD